MATNECLTKMLDKAWEDKPASEVVAASPEVLQGLTAERAQKIAEALGAKTVGELASNKYVLWAQALATLAKAE